MAPKVTAVIDAPIVKMRKGDKAALIRKTKLRYPELSGADISRRVGCDQAHVHRVLREFLGDHTKEDLHEYQQNKADVFDALTMRAVMSITDDKLGKSSAPALMMVAGTAFDKSQLVRGLATQVNVSVLLDLVDAARDMRDRPAVQVINNEDNSAIG
jgi:hypothetical protein